MVGTLLSLALALGVFAWVLRPLFARGADVPEAAGGADLSLAVRHSLQELETDLDLGKIGQEDLAVIRQHLEKESGG
jgi:hypothetical protein